MARLQATRNKDSGLAFSLALVYFALVAYASLYPFSGWTYQGIMPWAFASTPLPKYWSGFDVGINVIGYVPLGFLIAVAWQGAARSYPAWAAAMLSCMVSFVMEALQTYLTMRVASNADWALNTLGGALGGFLAWMAHAIGFLPGWARFRQQRFLLGSSTTLGLLLLWPLALLYPTPMPLGLGYGLGKWLDIDNQVLTEALSASVITLGLLTPTFMAYAVAPKLMHRLVMLFLFTLAALSVTTLSNGLSFGPERATVWLHAHAVKGLCAGVGIGLLLLLNPLPRLYWLLAFLCLVLLLVLVNLSVQAPYFAQTLTSWEQGRFIRFYGATQWLGLLWPYAALGHITAKLAKN